MKRVGGLIDRVADFRNLYQAYRRARKGKRDRHCVERFSFHLEKELLELRREILSGSFQPGRFTVFEIRDPKPRTIHAAPFRDRVLHHAVLGVLEPHFERWLDPDSFACRKQKGMDPALRRAHVLTRRSHWVLKSDIEKCFSSLDHRVLKTLLRRKLKDTMLLDLLERIIDHGGEEGRGLPIGNLTSQWFANLYLARLDRFVREELRPRGYIRYMDDFALFETSRYRLRSLRSELAFWAMHALKLRLKERATAIHRTSTGWPFLGFRVSRSGLRLRRQTWTRFRKKLGTAWHEFQRGERTASDLVRSAQSLLAHVERGCSRGLRRKELKVEEL